ncbi:unnamed protein product [Caenorhabditis sp. 36 PRJEB53466]|nr:unnamed protein product [Caenorhabditis sp. 36 PRJEB53466]
MCDPVYDRIGVAAPITEEMLQDARTSLSRHIDLEMVLLKEEEMFKDWKPIWILKDTIQPVNPRIRVYLNESFDSYIRLYCERHQSPTISFTWLRIKEMRRYNPILVCDVENPQCLEGGWYLFIWFPLVLLLPVSLIVFCLEEKEIPLPMQLLSFVCDQAAMDRYIWRRERSRFRAEDRVVQQEAQPLVQQVQPGAQSQGAQVQPQVQQQEAQQPVQSQVQQEERPQIEQMQMEETKEERKKREKIEKKERKEREKQKNNDKKKREENEDPFPNCSEEREAEGVIMNPKKKSVFFIV